MSPALAALPAGFLGLAWAFRSRWRTFWTRMTLVTGVLGLVGIGLARRRGYAPHPLPPPPHGGKTPVRWTDLAWGVLSALGLYGVFQVGDRLARRVMPAGEAEIAAIYRLRREAPRWQIALLLAAIIAPGEELFWRGLVQEGLSRELGPWRGAATTSAVYALAHVVSGNLTLVGAAGVAGSYWAAQYARQRRLGATLVSHVLWDLWIFLVAPTPGGQAADG